ARVEISIQTHVHAIHPMLPHQPIRFTSGSTHTRSHSPSPCHPSVVRFPCTLETQCFPALKCAGTAENSDRVGLQFLSQWRKERKTFSNPNRKLIGLF
ncbi:hypothetical protein VIGAN_01190500, partial [Vigna angularis var. angularis]